MHIWNWITGLFDTEPNIAGDTALIHYTDYNPATGLPMIGGIGGGRCRWQPVQPECPSVA